MADAPDFNELNSGGDLTPEELNSALNEYATALRQEMEVKVEKEPESCEAHVREFFQSQVAVLSAQIVWLANNADSETVRLNASKYGIEIAIAAEKDAADPIADIIAKLQANDKQEVASE